MAGPLGITVHAHRTSIDAGKQDLNEMGMPVALAGP
jgi:hypothetical protein